MSWKLSFLFSSQCSHWCSGILIKVKTTTCSYTSGVEELPGQQVSAKVLTISCMLLFVWSELVTFGNVLDLSFVISMQKRFKVQQISMNTIYFQSNIQLNLNLRLNIGIECLFAFLTLDGWGRFGKVFLFLVRWCGDCNLYIS